MNLPERLFRFLRSIGLDGILFLNSLRGFPLFVKNYFLFKKKYLENINGFKWGYLYPQPADRFELSGSIKGHYFLQDLFIAQKIFNKNPRKHVDLGSRVDGFVAHVASFREIEVFDIRKLDKNIPNIIFRQADFTNDNFGFVNYCDSISSLHAIEHLGLGRYGDTLDFFGYIKGLENVYKILEPSGTFYFSVPIGEQRIEFDAHRVFSVSYLLQLFNNKFLVNAFSYIDDTGQFHSNAKLDIQSAEKNFNCDYGCGIFELTKI